MFLCFQELAILEPAVDIGSACLNLCAEYCEHFQLILLLPLLYPEFYFVGHFVHMLNVFIIC
jgi:hypothetical protein